MQRKQCAFTIGLYGIIIQTYLGSISAKPSRTKTASFPSPIAVLIYLRAYQVSESYQENRRTHRCRGFSRPTSREPKLRNLVGAGRTVSEIEELTQRRKGAKKAKKICFNGIVCTRITLLCAFAPLREL